MRARVVCYGKNIVFGEKGNSSRHRRGKKEPKEKTRCLTNISIFTLFCRTTHNTKHTHSLIFRLSHFSSLSLSLSLSHSPHTPEEKKGKRMYVPS